MHEVLVNRLGGLSLPRKSVVRLTDRPDMTLDVYRGRKTTMQQQQQQQRPAFAMPSDDWKALSVNPAENGYFFESWKDKAEKGEEYSPSFIICAQDTVDH